MATILIVDDDEGVTQTFARMLRLEGYEVRTAMNAETGLREAEEHHPDAIILDLRMPLVTASAFSAGCGRTTTSATPRSRSSPATIFSTTASQPNCNSSAPS